MSRWSRTHVTPREPSRVHAAVDAARAARRGPRWSRPLGAVLVLAAALVAIDPDHPTPRKVAAASSARHGSDLLPRGLVPKGPTAGTPRFAWRWDGPAVPFTLVVCDEEQRELARRTVAGTEVVGIDGLPREAGRQLHWHVEAEVAGRPVRSVPLAFVFSR